MHDIEVQQQTDWLSRKSEVGEELRLVERNDLFHRFQFYDDRIFNDQVCPVGAFSGQRVVANRDPNFRLDFEPLFRELVL